MLLTALARAGQMLGHVCGVGKGAPSLVPPTKRAVRGKLAGWALSASKLVSEQQECPRRTQLAWPPAQLAKGTPGPRGTLGKAARLPSQRGPSMAMSPPRSAAPSWQPPGAEWQQQQQPLPAPSRLPDRAPRVDLPAAALLPGGEESLTHALEEINKRTEKPGWWRAQAA